MEYRYLGSSGLKVSAIGLGTWITFAAQVNAETATDIMRVAFENGINFYDTAESHSGGQAQIDMGMAFRRLQWRRSDFVVATNLFWGGKGPNDRGLSRKHIIEGLTASLKRLQLDYVDIVYAQRPDTDTPMEEIVRAFSWCIDKGMALYWGTSEWPAHLIMEAIMVARQLHLIEPVVEQPQYNMFHRDRVEKEYLYPIKQYKLGITSWSPLASGVLSGKYNEGTIPNDARLAIQDHPVINRLRAGFFSVEGKRKIDKVKEVSAVAKRLGVTSSQLAIAWCLKNDSVCSVITGASRPAQVEENVKAVQILPLLTENVMAELDAILANKPEPSFNFRTS
ncbi:voltage-dependent potassium channel, beta subunit [Gongronella butleri]|nr:voltage-dependent potassium channel, beta subunit [Gongronella butleri]